MSQPTPIESRIAALICAYADRAPTDVKPVEMTALAVAGRGDRELFRIANRPSRLRLALTFLLVTLLTAVVGAAIAGSQPLRRDPEELLTKPATVIGHYAAMHVGYVYVYADGRVVLYPDALGYAPGASSYLLNERRLTSEGVESVRSGAVPPSSFLNRPGVCLGPIGGKIQPCDANVVPGSAWAEPEFRLYEPTRYAICNPLGTDGSQDPTRIIDFLPAQAGALPRGKEHTYYESAQDNGESLVHTCFEVSAEDAHLLVGLVEDAGPGVHSNRPHLDFLDAGS